MRPLLAKDAHTFRPGRWYCGDHNIWGDNGDVCGYCEIAPVDRWGTVIAVDVDAGEITIEAALHGK